MMRHEAGKRLIGFIVLFLGSVELMPVAREFLRALFWDQVIHIVDPIFSIPLNIVFGYGLPLVMVGYGLYLLLGPQKWRSTANWMRAKLNLYLVVAAILAVASIASVALYFWDHSRGPIIWTWGATSPIAFWRNGPEPLLVDSFNIKGKNRWSDPIRIIRASIRSDISLQIIPLSIVKNGQRVIIDNTVVQPGESFTLNSLMSAVNPTWTGQKPYADTFRAEFPKFTFIFEYEGGKPYEVRFAEADLDGYIAEATTQNAPK